MSSNNEHDLEKLLSTTINFTKQLVNFWKSAHGWAPIEAANLLSKSRLNWQLSLTKQLKIFISKDIRKEDGALILAWVTLGSLVEGLLKLHLSVWYNDYKKDIDAIKDKKGAVIDPDVLMLEKLKNFFRLKIFPIWERKIWKSENKIDWIEWIDKVQQRRNAVHAFKHREIGTFEEFYEDLYKYNEFQKKISNILPYPDEMYEPR